MKKSLCTFAAVVFLLSFPMAISFSQEQGMDRPPRERHEMENGRMMRHGPGMARMPGEMFRQHGPQMLQMLQHNPKMAGLMMQMHGEMMLKQGEVLLKYGKMMQDLPATPPPAKK